MSKTSSVSLLLLLLTFEGGFGHGGHPLTHFLHPESTAYDKNVPPFLKEGPLVVTTNIYIREIRNLDLKENQVTLQLTVRQMYNDSRLAFDDLEGQRNFFTLAGEAASTVWQPDTFIRNERQSMEHKSMQPNRYARVYASGKVLSSQRLTTTMNCPGLRHMVAGLYEATCPLQLASYSFTADDLTYRWREFDPVQVTASHVYLDNSISLGTTSSERCDVKTSTGKYDCLSMKLQFIRD